MILAANKNRFRFWIFAVVFIAVLLPAVYSGEYFWALIPFGILLGYSGWQNISFVFLLLLVTIPFSAEYQLSPTLGTDLPDEPLMLITAWLFSCYFFYKPGTLTKEHFNHPLFLLLIFSIAWILITALFSTNWIVSLKFFLSKCWYLGAFVIAPLIFFKNKNSIRIAAMLLAFSLFTVTSIIIIRHAGNGFQFAAINEAVQPFFRNHVNYSAMLVCVIPLFFAFYMLTSSAKKRVLLSFAILILLTALFFSYSRGAWLALVTGLITYLIIRKKLLLFSFISAVVIVAVFLFWAQRSSRYVQYAPDFQTTIFHSDFREHLIATYKLKDVSTEERFYRWIAGLRMIKDERLTGYGPNTFYDNYKPYALPAFKTWVSDNKERSTVHNYFLLVTIEQGIPGLIFFLLLIGTMLYYVQKLYHKETDLFYKTIASTVGVILSMLLVVNFLSDLIETDKIGSIFFLCFSLLIVCDIHSKKLSDLPPNV